MDRFAPATSFRPGRPSTRTRPRIRHMSPSPRPLSSRRPFAEPSALFITTDYELISQASSPDSDLIFSMSPVHSHHLFSPPPSDGKPVNVMTLRNKPEITAKSPPLSPLLYSFPRPSRLHPYMNKNASTQKDILSKPLSSISQKTGVPTLIDPRAPQTTATSAAPSAVRVPLPANSFVDISPLSKLDAKSTKSAWSTNGTTAATASRDPRPPHSGSSSPIPIPRHTPRQSDPGLFDLNPSPSMYHPMSIEVTDMPDFEGTPYASSGIASHAAATSFANFANVQFVSPAGSAADASLDRHQRAADFDYGVDDGSVGLENSFDESLVDFPLSASDYSSGGSGPFRLARYLPEPEAESSHSGSRTSSTSGQSATVLLRKIAAQKRTS